MARTVDIGSRIELVPMDPHFHDISIALYQQVYENGSEFLVHTYSGLSGAAQRIESVAQSMRSRPHPGLQTAIYRSL